MMRGLDFDAVVLTHIMIANVTTAEDLGFAAGWDAQVPIAEPGEDPFAHISDEDLLLCNAGVLAAIAMAQANQMRVLDSGIVPDSCLVEVAEPGGDMFNQLEVSTPTVPSEKYFAVDEHGHTVKVEPPEPFYPGLAERSDSKPSAMVADLAENSGCPVRATLAAGCTLLQLGADAGHDVSSAARVLNLAHGGKPVFSNTTVAGLDGGRDYRELFAQDRPRDARRLASWQACSAVRSGQLMMACEEVAPSVHTDFRRIRTAAESLFHASIANLAGAKQVRGKLVYYVPGTTLLTCCATYIFPACCDYSRFAQQEEPPAEAAILAAAATRGVNSVIWPTGRAIVVSEWMATKAEHEGIAKGPAVFRPQQVPGAALRAAATSSAMRRGAPLAGATGRTVSTAVSAKISALTYSAPTTQSLSWLAKVAACVEVAAAAGSEKTRELAASQAWLVLRGPAARSLEMAMSKAEIEEMYRLLPPRLKVHGKARSAKTVVNYIMWELVRAPNVENHTIARGIRRSLANATTLAKAAQVAGQRWQFESQKAAWLVSRLGVLREFWACQYSALPSCSAVVDQCNSAGRWWFSLASAVNLFRATFMRTISVATDGRVRPGQICVHGVTLYCAPYHAAAKLRTDLAPLVAMEIEPFEEGERISEWCRRIAGPVSAEVRRRLRDVPRAQSVVPLADNTSHWKRASALLASEDALADWIDHTMELVTSDAAEILVKAARVTVAAAAASRPARAMSTEAAEAVAAAALAVAVSVDRMRAAPPLNPHYEAVSEAMDDDVWDDFCEATAVSSNLMHEQATEKLAALKEAPTEEAAESIARWIIANFSESTEETGNPVH